MSKPKLNKCVESPLYGKDRFKNIHFHCDFCLKEMFHGEDRICRAKREKCKKCGADLGMSDFSASTCSKCGADL